MWLSRNDILRLAPPSLAKELRGEDSVEDDTSPKRIGGITASPIEHPRCPKCGSTLLFNGSLVWCTFIGSSTEKACDFGIGIHRNITRSEATVLWWKSLDIGQRLTDDQIAMFRGNAPAEEVKPKVDGPITVEIVEATEHRPERVALGFYNVDHHIDFEQAIALANDILEKTGYAKKEDELLRQQLAAASNHGRAARLQPQANMFLQTYLNWLHSTRQRVAEDLRSDKEQ